MKALLVSLLKTFKYPVFLQGTLDSVEEYPDSFFTFWNFETPEAEFYDNEAGRAVWGFWIYFYSTSPQLVESVPEQARKLLKQNDFIIDGKPHDINVDKPTHTGVLFTVYKFENYNKEVETNEQTS